MELPLYELVIDDEDESGVDFIALVDKPAIKRNWIAFSEDKKFTFKSDSEKRIISGPAMIPDMPIYRKNEKGEEWNVVFRKDTIQKIVEKFFKQQNTSNFNLQHKKTLLAQGVYMIESFITDSERGIVAPKGFEDLPDGTWFISCKVDNDEIWGDFVKEGVFKGFSVEGLFKEKEAETEQETMNEIVALLNKLQITKFNIITDMSESKKILDKLKSLFAEESKPMETETINEFEEAKLADGITIVKWKGELAESTSVVVVTEEGEIPAPDGSHELQDGRKIEIVNGVVTKVEEAKEQKEEEKEEVEIVMSEEIKKELSVINEKFEAYETRIKELEVKAKTDSELIEKQKTDLAKQKEAVSLMFEIVEKLADEPSEKVEKLNTFNVKLSEQKENEMNRFAQVVEALKHNK